MSGQVQVFKAGLKTLKEPLTLQVKQLFLSKPSHEWQEKWQAEQMGLFVSRYPKLLHKQYPLEKILNQVDAHVKQASGPFPFKQV